MFSIKKSFANCLSCSLLESPSCILETNCEDDLTKVDVVFVAENPGKQEVNKGRPLVGKAGKLFRKYFNMFKIDKINYLLTNCVLCQTLNPDGTTGNPTQEVINRCKHNCIQIIQTCKPKLVVVMGTSPMSAFGIAKSGITNLHGNVTEWNGFKTIIIVHPSFVNRNLSVWEPKFRDAMNKVASLLGSTTEIGKDVNAKIQGTGIFRYKIPEKYYTDNYRLIDIQFLNKTQQVLYIFRTKDNKKIFHLENDDYVCYQVPKGVQATSTISFDKLEQIKVKYKNKSNLDPSITYEGDVKITTKHAMDYYYYNKGEAKKTYENNMFFDIEVDTGNVKTFPNPSEAKFPVNLITTIYNKVKTCYVLDNKTEDIEKKKGINYKVFNSEKDLLTTFIDDFKKENPDFLAGWNCINFDLEYLYNRFPKLNIKQNSLSPFKEFYVDGSKFICHLPGVVPIDQLFLYRSFTFTKMENYKLGFIAQHELGVTKLDLPLPFNEMYWKMFNTAIDYNIRDTELLEKLENKLSHINLLNELRLICKTSFESVSSFGQIDSLMVSYLKDKGIASKNADPHIVKEKYPGAFVFEPIPGTYDWITDFDFASLYPSLMITYNIGVNSFVMKTKDPSLGYELTYNQDNLPEKIKVIVDPLCNKKEMVVTKEQLLKKIKDNNLVFTINGCFFKPHKKELSVFGEVVDMLMKSRKEYKNHMFEAIENKDKDLEKFYYTRQLVYKVLANTLYGVTANKSFRFYNTSVAASITLSGQEALKTSIIQADAYMRFLKNGKFIEPSPLTKQEMFSDIMPNRNNEYIVTGDTDSIFCCFQSFDNLTVDNVIKWCSKLETFLNDDKIKHLTEIHNVPNEFNRLALKNELVISRGLFLAKKRYAIRVISNEGKAVDKINYMGVEIKRSDFPSESKKFLSELTELILKSEKFHFGKIFNFISTKEKEFIKIIQSGDKRIARPVSFGKNLKQYKTVPQGVRSMLAWNKIMYKAHDKGSRAYMFWVRGVDFSKISDPDQRLEIRKKYEKFIENGNKLEVIGIPDEEPKLPDFFIPDVKRTLKFVFVDRYELLLKPLTEVKKQMELLTI